MSAVDKIIKEQYVKNITELLGHTDDLSLLDLVQKLLQKSI